VSEEPITDPHGSAAVPPDLAAPRFGRSGRPERRHSSSGAISGWLVVDDAIALILAFIVAGLFAEWRGQSTAEWSRAAALVVLPAWFAFALVFGLFAPRHRLERRAAIRDAGKIVELVVVGTCLLAVVDWPGMNGSTPDIVIFDFFAAMFLIVGRSITHALVRRRPSESRTAVIVGAGEVGQLAARKLQRHPEYGIELVGFVDTRSAGTEPSVGGVPVLGTLDQLKPIIELRGIDRVLVADPVEDDRTVLASVHQLEGMDVNVDLVPRLFELVGPGAEILEAEGLPLVGISSHHDSRVALGIKRAIDVVVALLSLVVVAPVFGYAAWRIRRDSPGPIFFRQTRLGADMREFTMLKFRTMVVDTDESAHRAFIDEAMHETRPVDTGRLYKLDQPKAVTRSGRWLRRTSMDELPQLINVLRGDMSLVGPRPCIAYETTHFEGYHFERFRMPAGMTGLWQVTARGNASFAEALDMDVAYVRDWSLGLDISLLLRTPVEVLRQRKATL
jgi:exopolysaccharide biosynthesis polyprenyl glycosylphosphotransferase